MYDVTNIKNYIMYLKKICGLSVTLHAYGTDSVIVPSELMAFNIHDNSYCVFVKTNTEVWEHCIRKQDKIFERCLGGSFCGTCHAGVKEYVYPFYNGESLAGFISVSGYKCKNASEYINKMSNNYQIPHENLLSAYSALKDNIPKKEDVDTLVLPLCDMLELAYLKNESHATSTQSFCERVKTYIMKNHTRNISSEDICKSLFCSRSKLSHEFNAQMNMSIREYINLLRINDACLLLKNSDLSVTEIAYSIGFSDPVFFSSIFKKHMKVTPSAYRKKTI